MLLFSLPAHAVSFNASSSATAQNTNTLTWNHTVGAGANRKLIVGIGIEEIDSSGDEIVDSVTFNNVNLLRAGSIKVASNGWLQNVEVWYLDDASITSGSNLPIVITTTGTIREISAGAISLLDAYQGAPPVVTNSNTGPNSISTDISTPADNTMVIDIIGSGNANTFTAGAGQTERWDTDQTFNNSTSSSAASTKFIATKSTTTITQNQNANRLAHLVISIPPPGTVLPPAPPTKTCVTNTLSVNNQDVNAISGSSDTNIIAVADNTSGRGQISIFNGTSWVEQTDSSIPDEDLNDVYIFSSSSSVVVGDDGTVLIQSGTVPNAAWSVLSAPTSEDLTTVWAYSTNEIYVAGDDGRIYLWNGTTPWINLITPADTNSSDDFVDSWGDTNNIYFLTDEGKIFTYDRSSGTPTSAGAWSSTTPNCITGNVDINGFTSDGAGNFYLVGEREVSQPGPDPDVAVIYKWDGTNCNIVYQSTTDNTELNAITKNPDGSLTAVGDDGIVLTSTNGTSWTETTSGSEDINAVYTLSDDTVIYGADDDGSGNGSNLICAIDKPHLSISHDGSASSCTAEAITITAHDKNHNKLSTYTGTLTISTSTNNGDWSVNSAINAITNNGNGSASYTFAAGDNGDIVLGLNSSVGEVLNINIKDNSNPTAYTDFISEDPNLTVVASIAGTFIDTFSQQRYDNSDGTLDWSASTWVEVDGDGAGPTAGNARVGGNTLRLDDRLDTGLDTSVSRSVDLSTYTNAVFSFDYATTNGVDNSDAAVAEVLYAGDASWTTLETFTNINGSSNGSRSFTLDNNKFTNPTKIRFRISNLYGGNNERFEVDNVKISVTSPSACSNTINHIRIEHDGEGLTCDKEQVKIRACKDVDCNNEYTANAVTAALTPDGDTVTFTGNTTTAYVRKSTTGSATLGATVSSTPAPTNSTRCFNGTTETCNMNFVDTGFRFTDGANPPNTINIGTQIGGKPSNVAPGLQTIALQAVRTGTTGSDAGSCVGVFADGSDVSVEIASECNNPTTCIAANKVSITNNATTTAINNNPNSSVSSYSPVNLRFTSNSQAILSFVYPDVGQISLHARYNILNKSGAQTNNYMSGNSNNFVVRPFAFYSDITGNPAATTSAGTVFTTAGTDFTVSVKAVLWQSADDDGSGSVGTANDGIADGHESTDTNPANNVVLSDNAVANNYGQETTVEQVLLQSLLNQPSPSTAGVVDPALGDSSANGSRITSFAVATGIGTSTTINYDEVGIIEIFTKVNDGDYLAIGATETAKIVGRSGFVGRFYPHHFETDVTHACGTFTYSGQPFIATVFARNLGNTTTKNYRDAFAYTGVTLSDPNPAATPTGTFANNTIGSASFSSESATNGASFGVGSTQVANNFSYTFDNKKTIPDLLEIRATDIKDSTSSNGFTEDSTQIRSGRVKLDNVFGSELTPLTVPLTIQYYSDNATPADLTDDSFVTNANDSCSTYDAPNGTLANYTDNLSSGEVAVTGTATVSSGLGNIIFHKPGDSTAGPGVGNEGSVNLLLDNISSWLTYSWGIDCDNADGDNDTSTGVDSGACSTASFGLYRGDDRIIYWREVF